MTALSEFLKKIWLTITPVLLCWLSQPSLTLFPQRKPRMQKLRTSVLRIKRTFPLSSPELLRMQLFVLCTSTYTIHSTSFSQSLFKYIKAIHYYYHYYYESTYIVNGDSDVHLRFDKRCFARMQPLRSS